MHHNLDDNENNLQTREVNGKSLAEHLQQDSNPDFEHWSSHYQKA